MARNYELFGRKIVAHHQMTFEDQIRDVLVEEIHAGRWAIGERLPGILALAKKTGFGTRTMHNAFDKLAQEGFVEMSGNRGTYLKSVSPGKNSVGKIGVLLTEEQNGMQLILWYQHIILKAAAKRHRLTDVQVLPEGLDPRQALLPGAVFGEDVEGIISLTPLDSLLPLEEASRRIPTVFLCPPFEACVPKVTANVQYAYYELTHRMVDAGHTRVGFSYEGIELDKRQADMHLAGYRRAMDQRGLPIDEDLIEMSRELNNEDSVGISGYLKKIMSMAPEIRPTALVCGSLGRTTILTQLAPLCHVGIPEQLSVGSIGTAPLAGGENHLMTGLLPDFDKMMDACFDVLAEFNEEGGVSKTDIYMMMKFIPGDTLRVMKDAVVRGRDDLSEPEPSYANIGPLSEAVHY